MRRNGRHTASADLFDLFALEDRTGTDTGLAPHCPLNPYRIEVLANI